MHQSNLIWQNPHVIQWEMIVFLINDAERTGCTNGKKINLDFFLMPYIEIKMIKMDHRPKFIG